MFMLRPIPGTRTAVAIISLLALATTLGACSSDGRPATASAGPDIGPDPAPAAVSAWLTSPAPDNGSGIWLGTLSRPGEVVRSAQCLITEAGEIACVLYEPDPFIVFEDDPIVGVYVVPPTAIGGAYGAVNLADTSGLSGSGTLYAAPDGFLSDGISTVAPFTITDGFLSDVPGIPENPIQKKLELTISSLGEHNTFNLAFDHYYYREAHGDVSTTWTEGVYATFAVFDEPASLSIDAAGLLFSQSASGCVLTGNIGIIDWPYNGYTIETTMASCGGLSGAYKGLAFFSDFVSVNGTDNLLIAVFNNTNFVAGEARKYSRVLP